MEEDGRGWASERDFCSCQFQGEKAGQELRGNAVGKENVVTSGCLFFHLLSDRGPSSNL
ncbi:hypothetical protein IF2G_01544 [Cordyceps javanica]|nr:hypothetical protein IF2G_01544 [Cordyceps javanica]